MNPTNLTPTNMTLEQKTITTIVADEGKTLRRISDGRDCGERITLGYNYYEAGLPLSEPHLETPEDYEEVDAPTAVDEGEEQPISHESDIRRLKLAAVIVKQYKDSINALGLTDAEAMEVKDWHPTFGTDIRVGDCISEGERFVYEGELYKALTDHTILPMVLPTDTAAESLYVKIG